MESEFICKQVNHLALLLPIDTFLPLSLYVCRSVCLSLSPSMNGIDFWFVVFAFHTIHTNIYICIYIFHSIHCALHCFFIRTKIYIQFDFRIPVRLVVLVLRCSGFRCRDHFLSTIYIYIHTYIHIVRIYHKSLPICSVWFFFFLKWLSVKFFLFLEGSGIILLLVSGFRLAIFFFLDD